MIYFTFFVPKGELAIDTEKFLYGRFGLNIPLSEVGKSTKRAYWICPLYEIVAMRSWDIPLLTEIRGKYGITGKDILKNYMIKNPNTKLRILEELEYGSGRISVLGRTPIKRLEDYKQPIRVASPYDGIAERFFAGRDIKIDLNPIPLTRLEGGYENLLLLDVVDLVVDFVGERRTIGDNGFLFEEIEKILEILMLYFSKR